MKIRKDLAPNVPEEILLLWEATFGKAEAALERVQLSGRENDFSQDAVYSLWDNNTLLATVHTTVPLHRPSLCGVSGVCTAPLARGRGLGKTIFAHALADQEKAGCTAFYLGTSNPVAAAMYQSFGFSFLPGSNVMLRANGLRGCPTGEDFSKPQSITLREGDPSFRIPMIPLTLTRGGLRVLDRNTGLLDSSLFTQRSCMGLFPKYLDLQASGGFFFGAFSEKGVLGAIASVVINKGRALADFFYAPSFGDAVPLLLKACREKAGGPLVLSADSRDEKKKELLASLSCRQTGEDSILWEGISIPMTLYQDIP